MCVDIGCNAFILSQYGRYIKLAHVTAPHHMANEAEYEWTVTVWKLHVEYPLTKYAFTVANLGCIKSAGE